MSKLPVRENEFSGAPGGSAGTINYGTGYGTFSSPDASQNSDNFANSNNNKAIGGNSNIAKNAPQSGSAEQALNAIYSKRDVPSPDEIITGIKYELKNQIKKDKRKAKDEVLKHLRTDPHYYSSLRMLNIDDEHMMDNVTDNNMSEAKQHPNDAPAKVKVSSNIEETKKIFTELLKQKDEKYVVNSGICDVMKQMWEVKKQRSAWKTGQ
jgi:hypothetical protein